MSTVITIGSTFPALTLKGVVAGEIAEHATHDLFGKGLHVLFALPGAFTPTCSAKHLPGFVEHMAAFKAKGVASVACLSVNDAFVMKAWAAANGSPEIIMLADGNAALTDALGLGFDASGFGMGHRSQRFAMVIKDGHVTHLFVEAPGSFTVSSAEHVLAAL